MRKWIVFKATEDEYGWEDRKFAHSNSLTSILTEHFDSSDDNLPEIGYRPPEFVRIDQSVDPQFPSAKTHYRQGDWEVTRIETYEHEVGRPYAEYDKVVICYCKYNPINAPLKPMPECQVSVDSFGGDEEAYKQWLVQEGRK
ncbi:MAG TPA: hypothetical protein DD379_21075 [Cyanobacteria bacterium UBA11162]|nr:hypothetical protein [Cyanobacteria bacterium UBA11162]